MMRAGLTLILALTVVGCRVDKKDPRRAHVTAPTVTKDHDVTPADSKAGYYGINLNELHSSASDPSARVAKNIAPLAAVLLDKTKLGSEQLVGHRQTTWALQYLNSQIMLALKENARDPQLQAIIATYRERILDGCDRRTLKGCRNLEFYGRDPNLGALLKVYALQTTDVADYYRMIGLAYEIQGGVADPEFPKLVYARLAEFLKTFIDVTSTAEDTRLALKPMSSARKEEYLFYVSFLSTVLQTSPVTNATAAQSLELFRWLSSNQMDAVLGKDLANSIAKIVTTQLQQPELWSQFMTLFARDQRSENLSYTNALKRVKAADAGLLSRLAVTPYDVDAAVSSRSPELAGLFFLSRVFDLRPMGSERYLWDMAAMPTEKALEMIEAFVRVTLIDRMIDTNLRMAEFFRKYQSDGRAKTELISETMRFADNNLTISWKDYVTRIQQIEFFFSEQIERPNASATGTALGDRIARVRNLFEELNPSIKYMVTYPNIIMFAYYSAKMNLDMRVQPMGGSLIQINKDLILHDLMEGSMPPLLQFTSFRPAEVRRNNESLDSVQMMWALNFAMVTDLPKHYGISAEDFVATFISTYKEKTDRHMRNFIRYQEDLLAPNSDARQILRICSAPEGAVGVFDNQMDIETLKTSMFLGEFGGFYMRAPMRSVVEKINLGAGYLHRSFDEAIEVLRSDVDPRLRRIYLIKSAMKLAPSTNQVALDRIDSLMNETLGLRQRVLENSRILIEDVPECLLKLREIEDTRRHEVLAMEVQFLNQIQLALQAIQNNSGDEAKALLQLKASPFFADLDLTKPTLAALNEVLVAKLGFGEVFGKFPEYRADYARWGGFLRDGSGRIYFNHRSRDLAFRTRAFLLFGFEGAKISNRLDRLVISLPQTIRELQARLAFDGLDEVQLYPMTGDTVVRTGLKQLRRHFRWLSDRYGAVGVFRHLLRQWAALYKYEQLGELNFEKLASCDAACVRARDESARAGALKQIHRVRHLLEATRLQAKDYPIIQLFDAPSYFNLMAERSSEMVGPIHLFIDGGIKKEILGLADDFFTFLVSIRLGMNPKFRELRKVAEDLFVYVPKEGGGYRLGEGTVISADSLMTRADPYLRAAKYYKSLRDKDQLLLFPVDDGIQKQIELFHTHMINTDLRISETFVSTLYDYVQANPLPEIQFTLSYAPATMPAISGTLLGNYRAQIIRFHEDTTQVFNAEKGQ